MLQIARPVALVVLLAVAAGGQAEGLLDLVPDEAAAAFGIRNVQELKGKGDRFVKQAGIDDGIRPSQLFELACVWLGIKAGLDETGAAAAMLVDPGDGSLPAKGVDHGIVLALPFSDLEAMASNYGLHAKDFDKGEICVLKTPAGAITRAGVQGKHLLIGMTDGAIRVARRRKPLRGVLTAAERRTFGEADLLLYANPKPWGDNWKTFLDEMGKKLKEGTDREGQELADQLIEALRSVRFALWSAQVDDGLAMNLLTKWPEKVSPAAGKFLGLFQAEPGSSQPAALPDRPAVFVQTMRGNGRQVARLFRLAAGSALFPAEVTSWLPPPTERPALLAAMSEIYKHVKGHRVAIYRNSDPARHGLFSAVAILETGDGPKFISDMKLLASLAGASPMPPSPEDARAEIDKLIADLGADEFKVRESATDRLWIIGERALPELEKALKATDPEVRRRAKDLYEQIGTAALERRKTLVKEGPWKLRPSFAFKAAQKRGERTIETAQIGLTGKDAAYADTLRALLGPEWNRVRLATHGRHVVVLWGSDESLLDETLANLQHDRSGLAESKQLADFRRHSEAGGMIEAHGSLEVLLALLRLDTLTADRQPKAPRMTSLGLQVSGDRLRLDVWLPCSEIRAMRDAAIPR
jgi:hypothetical protein